MQISSRFTLAVHLFMCADTFQLECCVAHHIRSVAFCCISTGEFHFPNKKAAEIAVQTVQSFLQTHADQFDRIIFNVFKDEDCKIYTTLLG